MKTLITFVALGMVLTTSAYAGKGKLITYSSGGADYEGYYASGGDKAPLILLVHDWDGLTEYEMKRSDMLAELGYSVFAVDLFGKGVRPTEIKDKRQHTGDLYKDREKMRLLLNAGLEHGAKLGGDTSKAVAVGYCFGGAAVLEMARAGSGLKGFVSFHGGLSTPEGQNYSQTKGSILVLHGAADSAISMDDFARLNKELESAKVRNEMIAYSGAPHAFTVFGSEAYREDADKKSWNRFLNYLKETI